MYMYVIYILLCEYVKIVYVWYVCIIININLELIICVLLDIYVMFLLFIWMDNILIFFKLFLELWSFLNFKKKKLKLNWEIVGYLICFDK